MRLEWTAEEKVLLNIRRIAAEGWRMNSGQLLQYYKKIQRVRNKILPGPFGSAVLELLGQAADGTGEICWPDLLKDTEQLQDLIRTYGHLECEIWLKALPRLERHLYDYFKTGLGAAFVQALKCRLQAGGTENSSRDNRPEAAVCNRPVVYSRKELEQTARWLMSDGQDAGDSKKKERKKEKRRRISVLYLLEKAAVPACTVLACCFLGIWMRGEAVSRRNRWNIQQMKAEAVQREGAYTQESPETASDAADGEKNTSGRRISKKEIVSARNGKNASGRKKTASEENGKARQKQTENRPEILPQYAEMSEQYPQLYGWLKISGTEIDLPVMRSEGDREFYLYHDFTGAESREGALFVDQDNSVYPQDDCTVIYGHNMKNGHMFGILNMYTDTDFFQTHREIYFDTPYETGTYEAAAVLKTRILNENEQGFRYYQFFQYENEEEFQECLNFVESSRIFETDSTLQYGDQILMLSTCEYSQENGRLVVVARKL